MSNRILITGASIAGNTTALWLTRYGFNVTVVERTPEFRDDGQVIDVRGVGREVLRRMGLEQSALDRRTGEEGTVWVNEKGEEVARFALDDLGSDGLTSELEILRGDLARILYESARESVTFQFGDKIEHIRDNADGATVTFASGKTEQYDAVIVAEGGGSSTRELIFPNENDPRWMGLTIAYFTIPHKSDDDRMWRWYNATEGRSISLRPDQQGTMRAMLSIQQPPNGEQDWDVDKQKAYMRERFADAGWQSHRVVRGMDSTKDFYFDVFRQVRMKRWSEGSVVLTGDAAWCATPLAGIGATLAVTGGYILAGELRRNPSNLSAAFAAYEEAMRPMVKQSQDVPKIAPKMLNPQSRLGIYLLHGALSIASKPGIRDLAAKFFASEPKAPDLAKYVDLESRVDARVETVDAD